MSHGKALIGRRFQNGRARKRSLRFDIPVAKRLADNMSAITQLNTRSTSHRRQSQGKNCRREKSTLEQGSRRKKVNPSRI